MDQTYTNLLKKIPKGLVYRPPQADHWQLGGVTGIKGDPLTDGHWIAAGHIPAGENQENSYLDSEDCAAFGYNNRLEILWHRLYGTWRNFSDRWIGIVANTDPDFGNDPHTIAEAGRHFGLVNESDLPFDDNVKSLAQFYSPKPPTRDLLEKGKTFLRQYTPNHDWVNSDPQSLKDALKYSPIGVSVCAWYRDENGFYYFPPGMMPNHDTTLVDYVDGGNWVVFDSYPDETGSYLKRIRWDVVFPYKSKRYWIGPGTDEQVSLIKQILNLFARILQIDSVIVANKIKQQNNPPIQPIASPAPVVQQQVYDFSNHDVARHSVRVICDEEKLDYETKNILTACLEVESGLNNKVSPCENKDKQGRVWSRDWGICQINDWFHIGEKKDFPSVEYVLANPEKCVRWMAKLFKAGQMSLWSSYVSGAYLKHL